MAWDSGREFHVVHLNHGGQAGGYIEGSTTNAGDDVGGALLALRPVQMALVCS